MLKQVLFAGQSNLVKQLLAIGIWKCSYWRQRKIIPYEDTKLIFNYNTSQASHTIITVQVSQIPLCLQNLWPLRNLLLIELPFWKKSLIFYIDSAYRTTSAWVIHYYKAYSYTVLMSWEMVNTCCILQCTKSKPRRVDIHVEVVKIT